MSSTTPSRRGRPKRTTPDTRSPEQKRTDRLEHRKARAISAVANFEKLPDQARIRQPAVEVLLGISNSTLWRRVKIGAVPAPRRDGGTTSWSVGQIRQILAGGAQ